MAATKPTGERLATLEAQMITISERSERMDKNLQEVRDVLLQAKGVRWIIVTTIMLAGAAIGVIAYYFPRNG